MIWIHLDGLNLECRRYRKLRPEIRTYGEVKKSYPRRTSNTSRMNLKLDENIQRLAKFKWSNMTAAFLFIFHMPGETPDYLLPSQIYASNVASISIKPELITLHKLWNWTQDNRQCFFSLDRQLRFYAIYSQKNCEEECISNYFTWQLCLYIIELSISNRYHK